MSNIGKNVMWMQFASKDQNSVTRPNDVAKYPAIEQANVLADLGKRLANLENAIVKAVPNDRITSAIALTTDTALISSEKVAVVGEVTFADWRRDLNGNAIGEVDPSITQIRGGVIRTEKVLSWDGQSWLDLEATGTTPFLACKNSLGIGADGSFFFGAPMPSGDVNRRQLLYDNATASFLIGSEVKVKRTSGTLQTLEEIASAGYGTTDLQNDLAAGIGRVVAGIGGDYSLDVNPTSGYITAGRAGVVFNGNAVAGTVRPALAISSTGIAMGYNRASDGLWVNSVAIDSTGTATFSGAINATSGNFTGTVTAGSLIADTVTVGGTALSAIKSGAASGATAVQPAALTGYLTAASIANMIDKTTANTLSGTITPASGVANSGAFKIGSLTWNSAGALTGGSGIAITAAGIIGATSGVSTFSIDASGNATFKGNITGASGTFSGNVSTGGSVYAYGNTTAGGQTSSLIGVNDSYLGFAVSGVAQSGANSSGGGGVYGYSNLGTLSAGVKGLGLSGSAGVRAQAVGGGLALSISGRIATDDSTMVTNLNAEKLGGKTAAEFLPLGGTAYDASRLGGSVASDYARWAGAGATLETVVSNHTIGMVIAGIKVRVLIAYP